MKHLIGANGELNPKYPGGIIAQKESRGTYHYSKRS
jgi:hypothetical protein